MTIQRTVRTTAGGLAAAALAVSALSAPAPAQAAGKTTSLAQVLAADGKKFDKKWGDFDILDAAVLAVLDAKPDSAVGVLAKRKARLTAFLPTDTAFRKLATALTGSRPRTEKATFTALADAAGIDVDRDGPALPRRARQDPDREEGRRGRRQGADHRPGRDGHRAGQRQEGHARQTPTPTSRNPRVIATNINKGNPQIAHAINGVLLPVDL